MRRSFERTALAGIVLLACSCTGVIGGRVLGDDPASEGTPAPGSSGGRTMGAGGGGTTGSPGTPGMVGNPSAAAAADGATGSLPLLRLTRQELVNTLKDLL